MTSGFFRSYEAALLSALLSQFSAAAEEPVETPTERLVGVMTIRHDNLMKKSRVEIAPIARFREGHFEDVSHSLEEEKDSCTARDPETFPLARLPIFTAYQRGATLGRVIPKGLRIGSHSCSALCVAESKTEFGSVKGFAGRSHQGFSGDTSFDENYSMLVAVSPSAATPPSRLDVKPEQTRKALARLREEALRSFHENGKNPRSGKDLSVEGFTLFRPRKTGQVVGFGVGVLDDGDEQIATVTLLVSFDQKWSPRVLFTEYREGDSDHGSASYEFIDAVDVDGDGFAEVLAVFDNYEFHEFVIFKLEDQKARVVFRGSSFGC